MVNDNTTRTVEPLCFSSAQRSTDRDAGQVAVESILQIEIQDVGTYAVFCTPGDVVALAAGFAFSEGLINHRDDIHMLSHCPDDPGLIRMRIADAGDADTRGRNLMVVSSCGACGTKNGLEKLQARLPPVGDSLRLPADWLLTGMQGMHKRQELFARTGGTHAATIFSPEGDLLAFGEDVGRHNALDKAVGKCLLENHTMKGCAAFLSGRVSFDLVAKAARAGLELIAAVSAPSTLAIDTAEKTGITLCAFVREDRFSVYTHPRRIRDL